MGTGHQRVIDVAVALVRDSHGRVLLAERTARQLSPGFWELPGGKVDAGETPIAAARRELLEEAGLHADSIAPWFVYEHRFPTVVLRLHLFKVDRWHGEARGCEGQRVAWADVRHPPQPLLPSNARALARLSLPPTLVAVRPPRDAHAWEACVGAMRVLPPRADVVLDAPLLAPAQRIQLGRRLAGSLRSAGVRLFLRGGVAEARQSALQDVYSDSGELWRLHDRPHARIWIAEAQDRVAVARAEELGADAIVVPASRSGAPDWEFVRRIVGDTQLPWYVAACGAAGGDELDAALAQGAAGIVVAAASLSPEHASSP